MNIIDIPDSNCLRFVRVDNYLLTPPNFHNRLLPDEKWQTVCEIHFITQKFNAGDGNANTADQILIQFTTNIPDFICKLFDINNADQSANLSLIPYYVYQDGSGLVTYNIVYDPSTLALGLYYFTLESLSSGYKYKTEMIEFGLFSDLTYVDWSISDRDGINYGDPTDDSIHFGFRIEVYKQYAPTSEIEMYEGYNFQPTLNFDAEKSGMEFKIVPQPRFICEKLKLAFAHELVLINDIQHSKLNDPKITPIDKTNLCDFAISLNETKYEDHSLIQEVSGIIVEDGTLLDNYDDSELLDNYDDSVLIGII